MTLRRNILIFQTAALGDFILTWPLAMALGRIFPQSRVIYITHAQKGTLAERVLGVESRDVERGWHHLYGDASKLPEDARRLLTGAHSIYSFVANRTDAWSGQVRALAPDADLCCLRLTPPPEFPAHATDYLLAQLDDRRAVAEATRQMIQSVNQRGIGRFAASGQMIVIQPGSGSPLKCWPAARFLELAQRLRHSGRSIRIVLGEAELERWPAGQIEQFAAVGEVVEPKSYVELLANFADAGLYIGNDSGPSHLAGIIGLSSHCLFGPTRPETWRPLGPRVRVLQRIPMESLEVDEVERLVNE